MKRVYQNIFNGGLLGAAMLLGVTACTDDHFDVKTSEVTGGYTIWQNIKNIAELDSVAMILERTKVMSSETDKGKKQTFADLLNQHQELTVWLPKSGTFNAKSYLDELDEADALRATDIMAAMRLDYDISKRFSRNHIARFNYQGAQGAQVIRMLNGKNYVFDNVQNKFNDINILPENTTVSSNGMLYVLDGAAPFASNIYDYLAVSNKFSKLFAMVDSSNVYTFSESSSTQGAMNDKGEMEYVDSVYYRSNELLSAINVNANHISNEDSSYIAIMPTDAAFDAARTKLSKLYKYAPTYNYEWSRTNGEFTYTGEEALQLSKDSLALLNSKSIARAMLGNMFVSVSSISGANKNKPEEWINKAIMADSLNTTGINTIYNTIPGKANPVFDGKTFADAIKASNGYIIPVDNYKYDETYSFISKKEIAPTNYNLAKLSGSSSETGQSVFLTDAIRNPEVTGTLENDTYYYFPVENYGNTQMDIYLMLRDVLSCKYRISMILLPNRTSMNNIGEYDKDGNPVPEKSPKFGYEILDDKGKRLVDKKLNTFTINQDEIQKVVLWEEFEFPYTYSNLPDGYTSFPMLHISLTGLQQKMGKCHGLSIAKVILEPIREAVTE